MYEISFNISDEISGSFISASRWKIPNREDLSDDRVCNKCLKRYIGSLIDDYNKHLVIDVFDSEILALSNAKDQAITNFHSSLQTYQEEREEFLTNFTSSVVDDEG